MEERFTSQKKRSINSIFILSYEVNIILERILEHFRETI